MPEDAPPDARLVARILTGAWRQSPPPCDLTPDEIARVTPLLTFSGGTALGWWRVKDTPLADHASTLRGSAQLLALEEAVQNAALSEVCGVLNAAGVTPLLFKGWAVAASYPVGWLRPYGDFDLLVRRNEFESARAVLTQATTRAVGGTGFALPFGPRGHCTVDLHGQLDRIYAAGTEALFARARPVTIPGGTLLVPSPEDHLRLCAIHFFRHGGWRPLWLCDIAAMSEAAGPDFDWNICLGDDPLTASWTSAALLLAHRMLGARTDNLPERVRSQSIPDWLERAVLEQWAYPHAGRFRSAPFDWRAPWASVLLRWPDPVTARLWGGGSPAPGGHLHWQARHFVRAMLRGLGRRLRLL